MGTIPQDIELRVLRLNEQQARLWHASLRLWMWRWQTLTPIERSFFYPAPLMKARFSGLRRSECRIISFGEGSNGPFVRYNNTDKRIEHVSRYLNPPG